MKKLFSMLAALLISASAFSTTLAPVQLLNPTGSTSGQAVVSTGSSTAPGWTSIVDSVIAGSGIALSGATGNVTVSIPTNGVALTQIAQQSANTLLGNATGSTANVTAVSVTGCNGAAQALQWTNGSGFGCNSSVATSGANANITSLTGLTGNITGTGSVVLATSPTIAGLTVTGNFTPAQTNGIVGTTTNNNANAGSVGEYPTPSNLSGVSLTSGTAVTVASIALTAGDWDVQAVIQYVPAGSTVIASVISSVSPTTNATGGFPNTSSIGFSGSAGLSQQIASPVVRVSLASPATYYAVANAAFTTSTCTANGFIRARRIR